MDRDETAGLKITGWIGPNELWSGAAGQISRKILDVPSAGHPEGAPAGLLEGRFRTKDAQSLRTGSADASHLVDANDPSVGGLAQGGLVTKGIVPAAH